MTFDPRWVVALLCLAGCGGAGQRSVVKRVALDGEGRVWVAGTHGLAARVDLAIPSVSRIDLPRGERQSQDAFERDAAWLLPTKAGVLAIAESGDAFRLAGDGWVPGPKVVDPDVQSAPSVRSAFATSDGEIAVQLSTRLLWLPLGKRAQGRVEPLDSGGWIFWLVRVRDDIVGLRDRQPTELLLREGPARWRTLATVAGAAAGDSIGRWNDRYVLLHDGALVVVEADGTVHRVTIEALLRPATPIATEPAEHGSNPGLANPEPAPPRIWALYADDTGASVVHFASAKEHGLVDLAADPPRVIRCRLLAQPTIGVIRDHGTFVGVMQDGTFVRVQPSGCENMIISI